MDIEPKVILQLKNYLNYLWSCKNESEIVTIIDPNLKYSSIVDWFLTKTDTAYLVNNNGIRSVCRNIIAAIDFYIFTESMEKVVEYIYAVNDSYIHNPTFIIILLTTTNEGLNESELLQNIWNTFKFLDVYLLTSFHILTYNPFFNKILKQQIKKCEIFNIDKLKNLNGYKIKVSMFEDPPRIVLQDGNLEGKGIRLMKLVMKKMNATADIIIPDKIDGSYFSGANLATVSRKIDVSFMDHFTTNIIGHNESYSYPHCMDDFVVVVLKASEIVNYFNIYEIFDYYTWICIFVSLATIIICRQLMEQKTVDIYDSFIHVWGIFIGVTLDSTLKTQRKVKIIFITWSMGCLILNIIFSSLLASKIIKPKVRSDINTIEELRKLNLKIYISKKFVENIPKEYGLSNNLITAAHLERREALNSIDEETAVVVANTVFKLINDRSNLHVLKEHLLPGFSLYKFQAKSPFKKKIDDIIFKNVEYGLMKFNDKLIVKSNCQQKNNSQSLLKFKHFRYIFIIFAIGNSFAIGIFLLEILVEFYYKRTFIYIN